MGKAQGKGDEKVDKKGGKKPPMPKDEGAQVAYKGCTVRAKNENGWFTLRIPKAASQYLMLYMSIIQNFKINFRRYEHIFQISSFQLEAVSGTGKEIVIDRKFKDNKEEAFQAHTRILFKFNTSF